MLHEAEQVTRLLERVGSDLDGPSRLACFLRHNVGSVFVIVGNILTPKPSKVGLVERDDMVK